MDVSILLSHFSLNRLTTTLSVVALSATLALFAQPAQKASAQLSGSGATSIESLVKDWFTSRGVQYKLNSSGEGRTDFQNKLTDFVSTDITLPNLPEIVIINPVTIPIGFIYNVPGFTPEIGSTKEACDIFSGKITNWSQVGGPNVPITAVFRTDSSGTTSILRSFIIANCDGLSIPPFPVGVGVSGSSGVINKVLSTKGAVSYVNIPAAVEAGLPLITLDTRISGPNYIVFRRFYTTKSKAAAAKDLCLYLTGPKAAKVAINLGYDSPATDPSACDAIKGP